MLKTDFYPSFFCFQSPWLRLSIRRIEKQNLIHVYKSINREKAKTEYGLHNPLNTHEKSHGRVELERMALVEHR
jgi:hypothetical protein